MIHDMHYTANNGVGLFLIVIMMMVMQSSVFLIMNKVYLHETKCVQHFCTGFQRQCTFISFKKCKMAGVVTCNYNNILC